MVGWAEFFLYGLKKVVELLFSFDTSLGFSLGDFIVGALVLVIIANVIVRVSGRVSGGSGVQHD